MIQSSRGCSLPGGGNTRQGKKHKRKKKEKNLGLFQLHKLLPEASECCKKHTQIFRFKFNQVPGQLDLFECQRPPSFPRYFRLLYISTRFVFCRHSPSNLGPAGAAGVRRRRSCPPRHQLLALQPQLQSACSQKQCLALGCCFKGVQWSETWRRVLVHPSSRQTPFPSPSGLPRPPAPLAPAVSLDT